MTAKVISGVEVARSIREELKAEIEQLEEIHGVVPGLAVVIVGDDPASRSYVAGKRRACRELGIRAFDYDLPEGTTEDEILAVVAECNANPEVHGILVQLPLPRRMSEERVLLSIDPDKDVDGFHPINIGRMVIGAKGFLPCTPAGIQQLLLRAGVETRGAEVVVVGRSNIVGKPVANILMQKGEGADATVTVCHTRTRDVASHCRRADILIVAAGVPSYVKGDWVKEGAAVIDVGVNRVGTTESGKAKLVGDVDFEAVKERAGHITPVPGGVGPMTITMLMANTLEAAKATVR